ncbi:MAG TPA: AAA family ATPase, partial [Humisphaera sp.]|nr:AAA family ATPase [Humisphaera sp.]
MNDYLSDHSYQAVEQTLQRRLEEKPPIRLQLLVGPRQVGKTTLLLALEERYKSRAIYVSADTPEAGLPSWADGVWRRALDRTGHDAAILLIDEIQYLPQWSHWLKARFDEVTRKKIPLHVVVTGSSSLKIGAGAKETMAGRFERL